MKIKDFEKPVEGGKYVMDYLKPHDVITESIPRSITYCSTRVASKRKHKERPNYGGGYTPNGIERLEFSFAQNLERPLRNVRGIFQQEFQSHIMGNK